MKPTPKRQMNSHDNNSQNQPNATFDKTTTSLKRSDTVTQKLEEINLKMKNEHRTKNELQKKFDLQIKKIEVSKEKLEADLAKTITELNKMEVKVFEIQKVNLERFKGEVMKYENIYNELNAKAEDIAEQLAQSKHIDNLLYNQTFMLREDYLSFCNELILLKKKAEEKIIQLKQIESEHPKEFKFMQEEFQLENTLKTITIKAKTNIELIKRNIKEKESNSKLREGLLKQIVIVEEEMDYLLKEADCIKEDNSNIVKTEDSIKSLVNDIVLWEKMKEMMRLLFLEDNNNRDEEKNKRILKIEKFMLKVKMDLMQIKKTKGNERSIIENKLNEVKQKTMAMPKSKVQKGNEEVMDIEGKLDQIKQELNVIDANITTFELLFNKYIVLFKNESKEQCDIENRFKNDLIAILITSKDKDKADKSILNSLSSLPESIKSFGELLSKYFNDQTNRDKRQIEFQYAQKKLEDRKQILNNDIDKLNEAINSNEQTISNLQQENNQITKDIVTLTETITIKNKNLKSNLEALGEDQFNLYLESNETILKNMKKIYGNKILNKVFKVQKDKFLETIIVEHSYKKEIVNESIGFIVQYEDIKLHYKTQMEGIESNYQTLLQKYESCLEFQAKKNKEKSILDESTKSLKEKMELILEEQLKSIQVEKQNLQLQYNINFYIEQVKEISEQIERLTEAKKNILEDFDTFQKDIEQNGHQLFFENADIKQSVATLNGLGFNSPLRDDSTDNNALIAINNIINTNTEDRKNSNVIHNIEESVRKSLRDFHSKVDTPKIGSALRINDNNLNSNNSNNMDYIIGNSLNQKSRANATGSNNYTQNSTSNYKQYTSNPSFEIFTEKLKPLLSGLSLYKKFDSKTMSSRINAFDPFNAEKYTPENCGYAMRYFKLIPESKVIAIKKTTSAYHCELKLPLTSLVGIFLGQASKEILKIQESNSSNPNHQIELLCRSYFIPFTLVLENNKIDLIAPDYLTYTSFEGAIKDIILNKSQIENLMEDLK